MASESTDGSPVAMTMDRDDGSEVEDEEVDDGDARAARGWRLSSVQEGHVP